MATSSDATSSRKSAGGLEGDISFRLGNISRLGTRGMYISVELMRWNFYFIFLRLGDVRDEEIITFPAELCSQAGDVGNL